MPVIPPEEAARDFKVTSYHYLFAGSKRAALGFIKAFADAYPHIGRHRTTR
jgi:hypothetical protein